MRVSKMDIREGYPYRLSLEKVWLMLRTWISFIVNLTGVSPQSYRCRGESGRSREGPDSTGTPPLVAVVPHIPRL